MSVKALGMPQALIEEMIESLIPPPIPGPPGDQGVPGIQGPAGVNAFGTPNGRSLSLSTAYQSSDPTKPAIITVNITSVASLSLAVGQTNTADIVIGATTAVATGTGTVINKYRNSLTGTLIIGLAVTTDSGISATFALPIGWYFAVRQTGGTIAIASAYDQAVG